MEIKNLKRIDKNGLVAKFDLFFPKMGMSLRDFSLRETRGKLWIAAPSRQYQDASGATKHFAYVFFTEEKKDSFSQKVLEMIGPMIAEGVPAKDYGECPF